uniref:Uncharacterized protein n=1 Tax=Arion vulgaris TaxID=1028688 RepID=A0A0B6YVT2_9EUPU
MPKLPLKSSEKSKTNIEDYTTHGSSVMTKPKVNGMMITTPYIILCKALIAIK